MDAMLHNKYINTGNIQIAIFFIQENELRIKREEAEQERSKRDDESSINNIQS